MLFPFVVDKADILYFENYDLDTLVMPMKVDVLENLLQQSGYDSLETQFLCDGFRNGFSLGYQGPTDVRIKVPNLKLNSFDEEIILWNKVMKEVGLGRFAGPFNDIPFDTFIQSPISLVPKDDGKDYRLIFHLSYPRIKAGNQKSVNSNTPKEICTVKYPDFNDAIQLCLKSGKGCKIARSDLRSAFRQLCIIIAHFRFLVMKARSPLDSKYYYFVDKCLPFGSSISCAHFQRLSNAIAHIVRHRTGKPLVNYLDDYLFVQLMKAFCDGQVQVFLDICDLIGLPVSMEKTFWSSTLLTFLGLLINSVSQTVSIPVAKVIKARKLLATALGKRKITLLKLQQICGFLNFLGRCVIPGHAFTRRLYAHTAQNSSLKPHHHIRITEEMRLDMKMWQVFINSADVFCQPFLDFSKSWNAEEVDFYSDASGKIGFGGVCGTKYMHGTWDQQFLVSCEPSIEYLELFALVASCINWLHLFANSRIVLFCDNQSVLVMVNNTSSRCRQCMVLIRILVLHSLQVNTRVFAKYINTKSNTRSDWLSHGKISQYLNTFAHDDKPTEVPEMLWPIEKIWLR